MNWRTDLENCPKDRPFLVVDPRWNHRQPCMYTYRIVEYTALNRMLDEDDHNQRYGYAYQYDHEEDFYYTVDGFTQWMEIPDRQEIVAPKFDSYSEYSDWEGKNYPGIFDDPL